MDLCFFVIFPVLAYIVDETLNLLTWGSLMNLSVGFFIAMCFVYMVFCILTYIEMTQTPLFGWQ